MSHVLVAQKLVILEKLAVLALTVAAIMLVIAALTVDTLGSDASNHYYWLRAFPDQVWQGDLRPTWLPGAYNGLGAPTFYFYPPLTYWIATPLYPVLKGLSDVRYYSLLGLLATILAFVNFRFYIRGKGIAGSLATCAALLYAIAPFRVYEFFTRSGLSAQFAVALIPLVFAGIDGIVDGKRKSKHFVMLAVSTCFLILTNVPVCIVTCVVIVIYFTVLTLSRPQSLIHVVIGLGTGVLLASFYLVPIPLLADYIQPGHLEMNKRKLSDGVMAILDLVRMWNITESTHSVLNLFTALAAIPMLVYAYSQRNAIRSRTSVFILFTILLVAFFQIGFVSTPLWSIDAVRTLIQFPHRWSVILVFAMAIAYGSLQQPIARRWLLYGVIIWGVVSAIFSTVIAFDLRVHSRAELKTPFDPPEYATMYSPPEMGTVIAIAQEHVHDVEIQSLRSLQEDEWVRETHREYDAMTYEAHVHTATPVIFQQWRWPYWKLYSLPTGREVSIGSDSTGRVTAVLPTGNTHYELRLIESQPERWGKWLSLIGIVMCILYTMVLKRKENVSPMTPMI